MDYICKEYKSLLVPYIICSLVIAAFAPGFYGPLWMDGLVMFICTNIWFVIFVFIRACYLTIIRRNNT